MVWLLVKWWKIIIDKLTSGDMDEVLAMNEEERHCRLILGGCLNVRSIIQFYNSIILLAYRFNWFNCDLPCTSFTSYYHSSV